MPLSPVLPPAPLHPPCASRSALPSLPTRLSRRTALQRIAGTILAAPVAALLPALFSAFTPRRCRAEAQPTDDPNGGSVDVEQGMIFMTAPARTPAVATEGADAAGATVAYEWLVRFTGTYEQTVTLFQWIDAPPAGGDDTNVGNQGNQPNQGNQGNQGNAPRGGCWKRRAFLNSYYQGAAVTVSLDLAAGQKFLLVAYHKDAVPPATGQDWVQAHMDHGDVTKRTEQRPQPLVEAVFKHDKGATLVGLRPEKPPRPTTQPIPTTLPSPSSQPTSRPSTP